MGAGGDRRGSACSAVGQSAMGPHGRRRERQSISELVMVYTSALRKLRIIPTAVTTTLQLNQLCGEESCGLSAVLPEKVQCE